MAKRARAARRGRNGRRTGDDRDRPVDDAGEAGAPDAPPVCPLCLRPIPSHARQSVHHLVPKLKGGAKGPTVLVHQICHNEIHAALTEAELAREYDTPEKLRGHPGLARFVAWVGGKDPAFHSRTVGNRRRSRG